MGTIKKTAVSVLLILVALPALLVGGCSKGLAFSPPPYLPPEYYACTEVEPQALINVYFTGYGDFTKMEAMYNDVMYLLKDIPVDERMFLGLEEGYIWVDQIKCYLLDPDVMNDFKPGDKIDVVGLNDGPTSYFIAGLTFIECIVLPAGKISFASGEGEATFSPGY
jgi:hypothetical protein